MDKLPTGLVCKKCGGVNRVSATYCAHCGVTIKIKVCESSLHHNRATAKFCRRCGDPQLYVRVVANWKY